MDLEGIDLSGRTVRIGVDEYTEPILLAFLHIDCDGCHEFWQGFRDDRFELPSSVSAVIVTKGPRTVDPVEIRELAVEVSHVPIVMSDEAWVDYRVLGYPFFVLVDPATRSIAGETVGFGWSDVVSMIRSAGW